MIILEIHERIKILRKYCKLTQEAFGNRLSITRDMVNNLERGRVEIKEHIIKLICTEFLVNESWLRTGSEPMFLQTSSGTMEQLKKEFDLDEFSFKLVHEYLKLKPENRQAVRDFFYNVVESNTINISKVPETPEALERQYPPEESKLSDIG